MSRPALYSAFLLFAATPVSFAFAAADGSADAPGAGTPPAGFQDVKTGDGTIRVANQGGPHFHGAQPETDADKYDPENANYSRASSYANKTFSTGQAALSKNDTAEEGRDNRRFETGSYDVQGYNQAGHSFQTSAYPGALPGAREADKNFNLPAAFNAGQTFPTGKKSDLAGKQALIAQTPPKIDPFSAPGALSEKTFYDPALTRVKRDPYAAANNLDVARVSGLPNRALTIDEVRNLINHDQVPDLNSKPDAPSKALNDPGWEAPEALPPAHLDNHLLKPGPTSESNDDQIPPPGMMAQPDDHLPSK